MFCKVKRSSLFIFQQQQTTNGATVVTAAVQQQQQLSNAINLVKDGVMTTTAISPGNSIAMAASGKQLVVMENVGGEEDEDPGSPGVALMDLSEEQAIKEARKKAEADNGAAYRQG